MHEGLSVARWIALIGLTFACDDLLGLDEPGEIYRAAGGAAGRTQSGGAGAGGGMSGVAQGGGSAEAGSAGASVGGSGSAAGYGGISAAGSGGVGGVAEGGTGPTSGTGPNSGGSAGSNSGGATADGGDGGVTATGGSDASGGARGGSAGQAGDGGGRNEPPAPPTLGEACTTEDAFACTAASPLVSLQCQRGIWEIGSTCPRTHRCGPQGLCVELPEYCKNTQNLRCWDGLFYDCETNVGQLIYTHCPFGCDESGCLAGGGDRLIVHSQAPELHGEPRPEFPSDNVIPVCFLGAPLPLTWRLIRDEVVRTWGRRSLINFTGFGACDDDDAVDRIRIRFEENCRRRLVSELEVRFPNAREPEQNILGICRTYFDAHGELQTANDELLRFLTRHEFGHVLQLSDMPTLPPGVTVMTTGIRLSEVSALEISPEDLGALWGGPYILGKPPGSVVSPDGRCLSQSDGSTLKLATCSGAAEQFFQPLAGKVMHARSADSCLVHSAPGDARIGSCAMPEAGWSLEHLTMSSLGRCLAPEGDDATLGTALAMERCQPAGSVAQSFAIDPYATVDGRIGPTAIAARIRHSQSGLCVAARGVSPGSLLVLESCADPGTKPTQIFRFETGGLIASGDLFVAWPREEGLASIEDGSTYNAAMHWVLSGAIESAEAMPSALTSGPDETVSLTSIELLPYPEQQVFDLYY